MCAMMKPNVCRVFLKIPLAIPLIFSRHFINVKTEHSKNIEVGYVHDLRGFFPSLRRADIRLNWYKNTTKNIFDRDINYEMKQFDKRILEGVEYPLVYDQGRIFGDIGISYNIKINSAIKVQQFEMLVV